ncbi:ribosomal-processing cysteine protease Prp [Roseburia hominis]
MIQVSIFKNRNNECVGFRTSGHAGAEEPGHDIVCAAVSMLVMNTMNSIEQFTDANTSQVSDDTDGVIEYQILSNPTERTELLMDSMILGLQSLEDDPDYTAYIDLIFEEV